MRRISDKNSNNCVAGGFIFDQMDRYAHDYIKNCYGIKLYLFTSTAKVSFKKQICRWKDITMLLEDQGSLSMFSDCYFCTVQCIDKSGEVCATAEFTFTSKSYCCCGINGIQHKSKNKQEKFARRKELYLRSLKQSSKKRLGHRQDSGNGILDRFLSSEKSKE